MSFSTAMKRKRDDEPLLPSWEILSLLSSYLEPETLAVASCVSTTWSECFSSEFLWKSLLIAHHSSNFALMRRNRDLSYKHLFSVLDERDAKRRCKNQRTDPEISLSDLIFQFHVSAGVSTKSTVTKEGKDLTFGTNERFQIEADVSNLGFTVDTLKEVRMTWQVIYRYEKIFTIVDTTRSSVETKYGWFTDELPAPKNHFSKTSNILGDVMTSFNGEVLDKVGFGMVDSSDDCESLFVDDVLRYLQRFLVG